MTAILEVRDLCKTYRKAKRPAVDHLSFTVEEGAIYAFVGPNGAGKTTTIRIIATLLRPDGGDVCVGGYHVATQRHDVRRLLGFIPDEFGLYDEMLVREYLEFFAGCYGVPADKRTAMVHDLLELVGLANRSDDAVRTLSRGMRQRLGVARALVHDPALIVADEPAAGLDPRARVELREIFRALQEMGKTIFLSSHVLRELDDVATHVGIVEQGRLVASGPVDEIRTRLRPHRRIRMTFLGPADDAQAWLAGHPQVLGVESAPASGRNGGPHALLVTLQGGEEAIVQLLADLVGMGFAVLSYTEEQDTLESLFLSLTQGVVT
ncbi:MAG TPA: ABC transporter ATP-binding protein [Anaerolineae bacterium]|mgnify:CR=1 FL=1|nr:ABC transporter ATP-binding protein [Anaerolineae bacterium]HQK12973.1 ABC transporter ATP-binding protein [Anaerolineae bacterium]